MFLYMESFKYLHKVQIKCLDECLDWVNQSNTDEKQQCRWTGLRLGAMYVILQFLFTV